MPGPLRCLYHFLETSLDFYESFLLITRYRRYCTFEGKFYGGGPEHFDCQFSKMATVGFPQLQARTPTNTPVRRSILNCAFESRSLRSNVKPSDALARRSNANDEKSSRRLSCSVRGRHLVARRSRYRANSTGGSDVDNKLSSIQNQSQTFQQ